MYAGSNEFSEELTCLTLTQLFALVPINQFSFSYTRIDSTIFDGTPCKSHLTESESLMKVTMAACTA